MIECDDQYIIGNLFSDRLSEASTECIKHSKAFVDFTKAFPAGIAEEINEKIALWNADPDRNENPYKEPEKGKNSLSSLSHNDRKESQTIRFYECVVY